MTKSVGTMLGVLSRNRLRVEMKEKMNRSLNLAAHDMSSDRAYIMH